MLSIYRNSFYNVHCVSETLMQNDDLALQRAWKFYIQSLHTISMQPCPNEMVPGDSEFLDLHQRPEQNKGIYSGFDSFDELNGLRLEAFHQLTWLILHDFVDI